MPIQIFWLKVQLQFRPKKTAKKSTKELIDLPLLCLILGFFQHLIEDLCHYLHSYIRFETHHQSHGLPIRRRHQMGFAHSINRASRNKRSIFQTMKISFKYLELSLAICKPKFLDRALKSIQNPSLIMSQGPELILGIYNLGLQITRLLFHDLKNHQKIRTP